MPIHLASHPDAITPMGQGAVSPVFVCDACGERIVDGRQAVYLMHRDAQRQRYSDIAYVHRGACLEKYHSPDQFAYADDLTEFAALLLRGAHLGHMLGPEFQS